MIALQPLRNRIMLPRGFDFKDIHLEPRFDDDDVRLGLRDGFGATQHLFTTISCTGWSPTLHEIGIEWQGRLDSIEADHISERISEMTGLQMRRYHRARRLGMHTHAPSQRIDHIMVDRIILRARAYLPARIRRCLAQEQQKLDGNSIRMRLESSTEIVQIFDGPEGIDNPVVHQDVFPEWGSYDGKSMTLRTVVPETMLAAMIGRRVGEAVVPDGIEPIHMPILDRIVTAAEQKADGTLTLSFDQDLVPLE